MIRILAVICSTMLRLFSSARASELLSRTAGRYARSLPPKEGAIFLMDLDTRLYPHQGDLAIAYGDGLHPKHRLLKYHDFFTQRITAAERVIDIGCGNGAVAWDVAKECGCEVFGIDLNAANIEKTKPREKLPNLSFVCGDALTDLPDENFDTAVLSNVLEHIEKRPEFLRSATSALSLKRWLIRVPVFERDWRVAFKRELGVEWRLDLTHFTEFTLESFAEETQEAGLKIVHLEVRWGEIWSELIPSDKK